MNAKLPRSAPKGPKPPASPAPPPPKYEPYGITSHDVKRVADAIKSKSMPERIEMLYRVGLCTREEADRAIKKLESE